MDRPYQLFEDLSDAATVAPRLSALRAELTRRGLDGFVVPHSDEYQSEYLPACNERLAWLTSFTGSAGAAVVLKDRAAIFVDGRYTLQVRQQTDAKQFEPRDLTTEGPNAWLEANAAKGSRIGFDPWVFSAASAESLRQSVAKAGATLVSTDGNPIDAVWHDRPAAPSDHAKPHGSDVAGESAESKRTRIAEEVKRQGADAAVISQTDSICWLLNVRGADTPHTPFVLSYAILNADGSADWFVDQRKITPEITKHLGNAVRVRDPKEFTPALDALAGKTVIADPNWTAAAAFVQLEKVGAKIKRAPDPCQLPKACKNAVEVEGARQAHIRDGAALTRFLAWMAREAPNGHLTEIEAAEALEGYRRQNGALTDLSFDSISGAAPHAALPHYRVTKSSNRKINRDEIYLVDSGGQYPDGTTDVTRTMIVGKPTAEMRDRFTRVLKGHIALATLRFPDGTTGAALDAFARKPLWDAGLDYDHGTGHGVGSYLSVHEGPQNISKKPILQPLKPGMICSNEPGFYKEGKYGIRIENLIVVTEPRPVPDGERPMMEFETITLAPIDLNLVEVKLLTDEERVWLNQYHRRVREKLSSQVDDETRTWLNHATRDI